MPRDDDMKPCEPRCYDLAEYFLADEPGLNTEEAREHVALQIQHCIDSEIEFMREMFPKHEP